MSLQKYVSCKRKKFLTPFTRLLNLRVRNENINCNLSCNNNYFTTTKSTTPKHYWRGYYKCSNENCQGKFVAIISKIEYQKVVQIDFFIIESPIIHDENEIKFRTNGEERVNLSKDLLIKGTLTVKSENLLFNEKNIKSFQSIYFYLFFKLRRSN
jgi:hypothetical protein